MHQRFDKEDEKNINNTEMHPANQKAREFSRYLHHLQNFRSHYISLNDWTRPPAHKCINFGSKGIPKHRVWTRVRVRVRNRSLFIAGGGVGGERARGFGAKQGEI